VGWDVTRYAENLPKFFSRPGTRASKQREESQRKRYHPLDGVKVSTLCIIVDMHGIILAWYLPGILSNYRQVRMFALSDHSRKPDISQNAMLEA